MYRFIISFLLLVPPSIAAVAGPGRTPVNPNTDSSASLIERATRLVREAEAKRIEQPGQSLLDLRAAIPMAETSGNIRLLVRALRTERDLEARAGAYDEALRTGLRVLELTTGQGDRNALAEDWRAMATTYERMGALEEAIDAEKHALAVLKTATDGSVTGNAILRLMDLLLEAGRYTEFKHQSEDALVYFEQAADPLGRTKVLVRQGEGFLQQDRPADALTVLHRAQRDLQGSADPVERARALFALAQAHADLDQWGEARRQFDEALVIEGPGAANDPDLLGLCARIDEGSGHIGEALRCERRRQAIKDSLLSGHMAERMAAVQALYGVRIKERDMATLRERNKASEDELSTERWRTRIAFIASAVLLVSLVFLSILWRKLHRAVRRVQHKNEVINRQAQEIRAKNLELERQNLRLAETLLSEEEKDVILKEIHHRVKNDLQVVNALLKLQATYASDPQLDRVLHDCQARIRSMALVHEHIYKCGDLSRVNVKAHVMALASAVLETHGLQDRVTVDAHINYDRATLEDLMPLSLLLNELITNSAKHAFGAEGEGRITIALRKMGESRCELLFSDNGPGLEQERFMRTDSFGLELVRTLARQLNGTIRLLKGEGTTFQLSFELNGERALRKAS